jgi:hypothetical protein
LGHEQADRGRFIYHAHAAGTTALVYTAAHAKRVHCGGAADRAGSRLYCGLDRTVGLWKAIGRSGSRGTDDLERERASRCRDAVDRTSAAISGNRFGPE